MPAALVDPRVMTGNRTEREVARLRQVFLASLFVAGFSLRWLFADGDFIGDDAWYLYLSRGFGLEPGVQAEHPWFHIANRPVFYAFYHLSTYGGLTTFRMLGCAVGATVPLLSFLTARRLGATFASAATMAAFLCVGRQQLIYSAAVFPDVLAAALALGACLAAASRRAALAALLVIACVLAKESFVFVPLAVVSLRISQRVVEPVRLDQWDWLALCVPTAYVVGVTTMAAFVPEIHMQGWSATPLTLKHLRNMWLAPEVWPLIGWLLATKQFRILTLWTTLPIFYALWSYGLGRGIAPWYVVGPSALASVAAALSLDRIAVACRQARWSPALQRIVMAAALLCFVPVQGLLHVRAQLVHLHGRFPWPTTAAPIREIVARERPEHLLLVDCFWAFRYSHLRTSESQPAQGVWWSDSNDTPRVVDAARHAPLIVTCRRPKDDGIVQELKGEPLEVVFEDQNWLVQKPRS